MLFVTSRTSKDIRMSIAFIFTHVRIPKNHGWVKLVRVLIYIRVTPHPKLILRSDSLSVIKWWVNAYFAAHSEFKGHTGAMISIGLWLIMEISWKPKMGGDQKNAR